LKDSKKLSPARREYLYEQIMQKAKAWGIGEASPAEIDEINILQATMLAMRRAIEDLTTRLGTWPDKALIDGNRCPELPIAAEAIVKGDAKEPAISAASILAKCKNCTSVTRSMDLRSIWGIQLKPILQPFKTLECVQSIAVVLRQCAEYWRPYEF
jgi:ribonuclease HII